MRNINIIFKINGNSSYINKKKIDIIVLEKIILWTRPAKGIVQAKLGRACSLSEPGQISEGSKC